MLYFVFHDTKIAAAPTASTSTCAVATVSVAPFSLENVAHFYY